MFKKHDNADDSSAPTSLRPGSGTSSSSLGQSSTAESRSTSSGPAASIGPSIRINGDIAGNENLVINGQVAGSISLPNNTVSIGKEGSIDADVSAQAVEIEGKVSGTVQAAELVRVKPSGSVKGDIAAPRVVLEDGCQFRGGIDMTEQQIAGAIKQKEPQAKANVSAMPQKSSHDQSKMDNTAKA